MRYGLLQNFTTFLFLFIIRHDFPIVIDSAYAASLNNSDEIKNLFSHADDTNSGTDPDFKGSHRNGSFAEGGVIDIKGMPHTYTIIKKMEQNLSNSSGKVFEPSRVVERENITSAQRNGSSGKIKSNFNSSSSKTLQDTKLPGTGSNLFLGVPEVIHVNGISSIKPRKGVNFNNIDNKIVPRKGVDDENKESFLLIYSCFQLNENDCYNAEDADFKCSCCKKGNTLGEIFKQKALISCNKCKPMTNPSHISVEDEVKCENICCKSVFHDKNSKPTSQHNFVNIRNNSILKPTITKVPYDVEVMTELLSQVKPQKIFLPVVVSLILLPLIGLSMFFMWQKTKEYWDKRFYKRMDFLIDGMYND